MSQFILALHASHNAAACIGDGHKVLYAIQEERLNGEKNYWGYPKLSIDACLKQAGVEPHDLAAVVYGGETVLCRYHSRDDVMKSYRRQFTMLGRLRQRVAMPLITKIKPNFGHSALAEHLASSGLGKVPRIHYDHHLSHAATAYYGLRRNAAEKYLVLTCDGAGDRLCASVRVMGGGENKLVAATDWGDSLGAIYSWITFGMGFVPMEHEYKLMGMAPYASSQAAEETAQIFHKYLGLTGDEMGFARKVRKRMADVYQDLERDLRGKRFDYVCAGLQRFTEDLLCRWAAAAARSTGIRKVLAAGGVFMNVKANKRIAELPEVDEFEAFPSCGDETLPFGAYYLEAAKRYRDEDVEPLKHFYLGDAIAADESEQVARDSGYVVEKPVDMAARIAELLATGKPVARAAGPMEFGARALGNRSILADPSNQDVVRVINQMVKKRDFWMPFAPMVLARRQHDYIQNPKKLRSPYMMMTFDVRENFRDLIAAVHNADLTCRAQLLEPEHNPEMHAILEAFEKRTGRGVILNTSFNLHGYPIVRTAADALFVLKNSGLEHLQIGEFLLHKQPI